MVNNKVLERTKSRPFDLFFNRYYDSTAIDTNHESADESQWLLKSQKLFQLVFPRIMERSKEYRDKYSKKFDTTHNILPDLEPGKLVVIKNQLRKKTEKLTPRWNGPYIIKRMTNFGTYEVETVDGEPYPNKISRNELKELPDDFMEHQNTSNAQEWQIETIKAHRFHPKTQEPQFKVKWRGLDNRHNSWRVWNDFYEKEMLTEYIIKTENPKLLQLIK